MTERFDAKGKCLRHGEALCPSCLRHENSDLRALLEESKVVLDYVMEDSANCRSTLRTVESIACACAWDIGANMQMQPFCDWCGWWGEPTTQAACRYQHRGHEVVCPKHPMRALEARLAKLEAP
ncbi:MAG: hypothetical protein WC876_01730 [Candidatus Thermoplasmatota archaeon]